MWCDCDVRAKLDFKFSSLSFKASFIQNNVHCFDYLCVEEIYFPFFPVGSSLWILCLQWTTSQTCTVALWICHCTRLSFACQLKQKFDAGLQPHEQLSTAQLWAKCLCQHSNRVIMMFNRQNVYHLISAEVNIISFVCVWYKSIWMSKHFSRTDAMKSS